MKLFQLAISLCFFQWSALGQLILDSAFTGHIIPAKATIPVAFVLTDDAVTIDFAGPWELFKDVFIKDRGRTPGRPLFDRPYTAQCFFEGTAPFSPVEQYANGDGSRQRIIGIIQGKIGRSMSNVNADLVRLSVRIGSMSVAVTFLAVTMFSGYHYIGWPPVIIVGGSGTAAFVLWSLTYLRRPVAPEIVLPAFLLTVAALEVHMIEEYLTRFGPAMSRLFDISWSEGSFLMIFAFIGPILYTLTALGLFRRIPLAGFLMCFIFIGPGTAEFTHFIFPALRPDVQPTVAASVQAVVGRGKLMHDLPNFWVRATGRYYFPGMYTAILPMIPGIYGIRRLLTYANQFSQSDNR